VQEALQEPARATKPYRYRALSLTSGGRSFDERDSAHEWEHLEEAHDRGTLFVGFTAFVVAAVKR
jgi:hypothetical protein